MEATSWDGGSQKIKSNRVVHMLFTISGSHGLQAVALKTGLFFFQCASLCQKGRQPRQFSTTLFFRGFMY